MPPDVRNCHGCIYLEREGDSSVGIPEYWACNKAYELHADGECSEQTSLVIEGMLFALSELRHCPFYTEKRRSILDYRPKREADSGPAD